MPLGTNNSGGNEPFAEIEVIPKGTVKIGSVYTTSLLPMAFSKTWMCLGGTV